MDESKKGGKQSQKNRRRASTVQMLTAPPKAKGGRRGSKTDRNSIDLDSGGGGGDGGDQIAALLSALSTRTIGDIQVQSTSVLRPVSGHVDDVVRTGRVFGEGGGVCQRHPLTLQIQLNLRPPILVSRPRRAKQRRAEREHRRARQPNLRCWS